MKKQVVLFVTCLVDLMRPQIGFAAIKLLEQADCEVVVPKTQTCCGQPAYNTGDLKDTKALAKQYIEVFEPYDFIVAPSGSCTGMIHKHYPTLFADDTHWKPRAEKVAKNTYELLSFLTDICQVTDFQAACPHSLTYHDSCAGLRELKIQQQPRQLINNIQQCEFKEMKDSHVCCGFGGTFCVKYPDISNAMVHKKCGNIDNTQADILAAGDLGCLMNMAGKLKRENKSVRVYHLAEVLANMTDQPGIGEADHAE